MARSGESRTPATCTEGAGGVIAANEHPEESCRRCGGPNVSWSAPSPLWNAVMRGGSIDGPWEHDELVCPTCFAVLAEERGVATGWRLDATDVAVQLETVTPSGRVWDANSWLWKPAPFDGAGDYGNPDAFPQNGDRFRCPVVISVGLSSGDHRAFEVEDQWGRVIAQGSVPYEVLEQIETAALGEKGRS